MSCPTALQSLQGVFSSKQRPLCASPARRLLNVSFQRPHHGAVVCDRRRKAPLEVFEASGTYLFLICEGEKRCHYRLSPFCLDLTARKSALVDEAIFSKKSRLSRYRTENQVGLANYNWNMLSLCVTRLSLEVCRRQISSFDSGSKFRAT
jgi:hypothetical protein